MKNHTLKFVAMGATLLLGSVSQAQFGTFAFQGLYAGNGGAFTSVDGNGGPATEASPFTVSHQFSGKDRQGHDQTMTIQGSAYSYASYGHIHVEGQGNITNPYYNSNNPAYFDGTTLDVNGSPDLLAINGNAGFTDEFTYFSDQNAGQTGYTVNFLFQLDGAVSGDTLAGLNFSTSDPLGLSYNPRTIQAHEIWATPFYHMEWGQTLSVAADFFAGFNTNVSNHPDGINYGGSAGYGHTLSLIGMTVKDSSGNVVNPNSWRMTAASGATYAVPEPASMSIALVGLLALRRKRKA